MRIHLDKLSLAIRTMATATITTMDPYSSHRILNALVILFWIIVQHCTSLVWCQNSAIQYSINNNNIDNATSETIFNRWNNNNNQHHYSKNYLDHFRNDSTLYRPQYYQQASTLLPISSYSSSSSSLGSASSPSPSLSTISSSSTLSYLNQFLKPNISEPGVQDNSNNGNNQSLSGSSASTLSLTAAAYAAPLITIPKLPISIGNNNEFICATQFGYYRDPSNCSAYFICSFGIALHKNCSYGLYFSERLQICDWPTNVPCEQDYTSLNDKSFQLEDESVDGSLNALNVAASTTSPALLYNHTDSSAASTQHSLRTILPFNNGNKSTADNVFNHVLFGSESLKHEQNNKNNNNESNGYSITGRSLNSTPDWKPSITAIKNFTNSHIMPHSNTLDKHTTTSHNVAGNGPKKVFPPFSYVVVDGFDVPTTTTTTAASISNVNINKTKSTNLNRAQFNDLNRSQPLSNYPNNSLSKNNHNNNNNQNNSQFMEISKLNSAGRFTNSTINVNNGDNDNVNNKNNNNNQFQKRQGFEIYWPDSGGAVYLDTGNHQTQTIARQAQTALDRAHVNPFTIFVDRTQKGNYFNNNKHGHNHNDDIVLTVEEETDNGNDANGRIHLETNNPYISYGKNKKKIEPIYWLVDDNGNNNGGGSKNNIQTPKNPSSIGGINISGESFEYKTNFDIINDNRNQNQNLFQPSNVVYVDDVEQPKPKLTTAKDIASLSSSFPNNNNNNNNKRTNHQQQNGAKHNRNQSRTTSTIKPTSPIRRKIPELYIKIVTNDNYSSPYVPIDDNGETGTGIGIVNLNNENNKNNNNNNKDNIDGLMILEKPSSSLPAKGLQYEINERLLAPVKHYQDNYGIAMTFFDSNNNNRTGALVAAPFNGVNRYSTTFQPINQQSRSFRKKIIRKKKLNDRNQQNQQQPEQKQQESKENRNDDKSTSSASALAASSSTNIFGHTATHLLTGAMLSNPFKANNNDKTLINSRPPMYLVTTAEKPIVSSSLRQKNKIGSQPRQSSPLPSAYNHHKNNLLRAWTPLNISATPSTSTTTSTTTTTAIPNTEYSYNKLPNTTPKPTVSNWSSQIKPSVSVEQPTTQSPINAFNRNPDYTKITNDRSVILVPLPVNQNAPPKQVNQAQYNSYVVIASDQNDRVNNGDIGTVSSGHNAHEENSKRQQSNNAMKIAKFKEALTFSRRFESQYETNTKAPIDQLEEFIKKTIDNNASNNGVTPINHALSSANSRSTGTGSTMATNTATTLPNYHPENYNGQQQFVTPIPVLYPVSSTTTSNQDTTGGRDLVFKKIKTISGHRRSRKYRPLITLYQTTVPIRRNSSIGGGPYSTTLNPQQFKNTDDYLINNNSKVINLSDPSTITIYETLRNNDVESQSAVVDQSKLLDNRWPLTTTPNPYISRIIPKSINGDRYHHNHHHQQKQSSLPVTTVKDDYFIKENAYVPNDINGISLTSTTKPPRFTSPAGKVAYKIRVPVNSIKLTTPTTTSTTTTTTTTTTIAPFVRINNNNLTEYNYYDYGDNDNYDNDNEYDVNNYDNEYYNVLENNHELPPSTTTTTTTTTSTTTTTPSPISPYRRTNVTSKPLIYLRNKPRPTNRRLIIKAPDSAGKIIAASRPKPLYPQPKALVTAGKCEKRKCRLPDCRCGSSDIPGDLSNKQIPQLVMLTFDDAVNDLNWDLYEELLHSGRTNPNGCPIRATFYVSHEWTDYGQVQTLYSRGHEIASHTISHRFGEKFSKDEWIKEINGQREILHLYGGVKFEDIRGMRAPFLQTGGNNMFEMLYETNFTYDSSLPVQENNPAYWPYTLDYALAHSCNIPPCPTKSFPGVWEVGMVMWSDLRGGRCSMGDACTNPPDEEGVYEMLIKNFNRHYKNNRAPFSLYYHSAWFNTQHHRKGFIKFLDEIIQNKDVYLVTTWQMLQWVREPVPLDRLKSFAPFQCNKEPPVAECSRAKICNVNSKQGSRTLRTCQECPVTFPWIGNTGFSKAKYGR